MDLNLSWSVKNGALIPPTRWMQIEAVPDLEWNAHLRKLIERKFEPLTLRFIKKGEGLRWFQYGAMYMKPSLSLNKGTMAPPDQMVVSGSQLTFRFVTETEFNEMDELTKLKLFVHGFSLSVGTKDLVDYFSRFVPGKVVHSQIAPSSVSSRSHFGYVLFKDRKSLNQILDIQTEHTIKGEVIKVQEYDSKVRKGGSAKPPPSFRTPNTSQAHALVKHHTVLSSGGKLSGRVPEPGFENRMKERFIPSPSLESNMGEKTRRPSSQKLKKIHAFLSQSQEDALSFAKSMFWEDSKSDTRLDHLSHLYYQKKEWQVESADFSPEKPKQAHPEDFVVEVLRVPSELVTVKSKKQISSSGNSNFVFNLLTSGHKLKPSAKKP